MLARQREKDLKDPPLPLAPFDGRLMARVDFLVRTESKINVGCHYGPDDLPAHVWDELIVLSIERSRMDRILEKRRDKDRGQSAELSKARQATGTPAPGQTLFQHDRPFVR